MFSISAASSVVSRTVYINAAYDRIYIHAAYYNRVYMHAAYNRIYIHAAYNRIFDEIDAGHTV